MFAGLCRMDSCSECFLSVLCRIANRILHLTSQKKKPFNVHEPLETMKWENWKHLKVIEKVSEIFTLSLKNKDLQGKKGKKNLQYHNILFGKHIFYKHNTCPLLKIWKLYECTENQIISPSSFFPEKSATGNFVHWFSIYHLSLQWNITSCLLSHTSII